jgi:hypothetical protein
MSNKSSSRARSSSSARADDSTPSEGENEALLVVWACAHLLPRVLLLQPADGHVPDAMELLLRVSKHVSKHVASTSTAEDSLTMAFSAIGCQADVSAVHTARLVDGRQLRCSVNAQLLLDPAIWQRHMRSLKAGGASSVAALRAAASYLSYLKEMRKVAKPSNTKARKTKVALTGADVIADILSEATFRDLAPVMAPMLAHHTLAVRRLTATVLAMFPPLNFELSDTNTTSELAGECSMLATVEETIRMEPTLTNEKSISSGIIRVQSMMTSTRLPGVYIACVPYFLLGMLRVKFSHVWKPCKTAMGVMASTYGHVLWPVYHALLAQSLRLIRLAVPHDETGSVVGTAVSTAVVSHKQQSQSRGLHGASSTGEESFALPVPVAPAMGSAECLRGHLDCWATFNIRTTDDTTYHGLLMGLGPGEQGMSTLLNKHGQQLATMFEAFLAELDAVLDYEDSESPSWRRKQSSGVAMRVLHPSKTKIKAQLQLWLNLMAACFSKQLVAKLANRDLLKRRFVRCLAMSETPIQSGALDCLVKYEMPFLNPYKDRLHRLINEKTFRNEMVLFHLDPREANTHTHTHIHTHIHTRTHTHRHTHTQLIHAKMQEKHATSIICLHSHI